MPEPEPEPVPGSQRSRGLPVTAAVLIALVAYLMAFAPHSYDDAYIIFRYAERLGTGKGFTYNDGERVLGVTTPLWTLALALPGVAGRANAIPIVAGVVSALLLAAAAALLAAEVQSAGGRVVTLLLASLTPLALKTLGGEMPLVLLLGVGALREAARGRELSALGLAGLALLARPDAGLVGLLATLALARRGDGAWRVPWRGLALAALIVAPWALFAVQAFGSPLPQTLAAKRIHAELGLQPGFLAGAWRAAPSLLGGPRLARALVILAASGLSATLRKPTAARLVVAWGAAHAAALHALGVPYYHWYTLPLLAAAALLAGNGVDRTAALTLRRFPMAGRLAAGLVSIVLVGALLQATEGHRKVLGMKWRQLYAVVGQHLARTAPPDASIAYHEVGYIGYHSRRRIIDLVGLVSPLDREALARGDLLAPLRAGDGDYVIVRDGDRAFTGRLLEEGWFLEQFRPSDRFADLTLYRRTAPARRAP